MNGEGLCHCTILIRMVNLLSFIMDFCFACVPLRQPWLIVTGISKIDAVAKYLAWRAAESLEPTALDARVYDYSSCSVVTSRHEPTSVDHGPGGSPAGLAAAAGKSSPPPPFVPHSSAPSACGPLLYIWGCSRRSRHGHAGRSKVRPAPLSPGLASVEMWQPRRR
jgi:hypothetical protein